MNGISNNNYKRSSSFNIGWQGTFSLPLSSKTVTSATWNKNNIVSRTLFFFNICCSTRRLLSFIGPEISRNNFLPSINKIYLHPRLIYHTTENANSSIMICRYRQHNTSNIYKILFLRHGVTKTRETALGPIIQTQIFDGIFFFGNRFTLRRRQRDVSFGWIKSNIQLKNISSVVCAYSRWWIVKLFKKKKTRNKIIIKMNDSHRAFLVCISFLQKK